LRFFALSPLLLAHAVAPAMRRRGCERTICIGSGAVELGTPRSSAYVAAKAAQLGLTRSWARELAPDNIAVNLVAPGFVPTARHTSMPQSARDTEPGWL
jgi:3-oxoacyl-[acyl-carrier protein] reductase